MDENKLLTRVLERKKKFETGWWKDAEKAVKMYDAPTAADADEQAFNILYANTEILLPSLYSSTPRPEVATRPAGAQQVSEAVSRLLVHLLDDNVPSGTETFDHALEGAALSGLVPGAGGVRLRYYPGTAQPIRWEEYKYNQLLWGYARKWSKVPWIAFIHPMTKRELVAEFQVSEEDAYRIQEDESSGPGVKECTYDVFELWDKESRKVYFLCEDCPKKELRVVDDELKLSGFFPTPGPLTLVRKPVDLDPTPLYAYYKRQAEELNRITVRLEKVTSAIRVRGVFNNIIGADLQSILGPSGTENGLVPSTNPVDLAQGGFEKHIWMLPIDKLIQVAQQLQMARQNVLQVIYQLTGLADIVRGSTAASESATAQSIKDKWGGLRLKRMQRTVALYVRELLRQAAELAANVLQPMEWEQLTGVKLPMMEQKQQAMLAYQQQAMIATQTGQPPPPSPDLGPAWEEVISSIREGKVGLLIDIETSSTLDPDSQADQKEVGEFLGPFSQLVQALGPVVQMGPSGLEAGKALLVALLKRYKLGREVERAFKALQPPPPPQANKEPPDPMIAVKQQEAQLKMQELQQKAQLATLQHEMALAELSRKDEAAKQKAQLDAAKYQQQIAQAMLPPVARPAAPRRS